MLNLIVLGLVLFLTPLNAHFNTTKSNCTLTLSSNSNLLLTFPVTHYQGGIYRQRDGTLSGSTFAMLNGLYVNDGRELSITGTLDFSTSTYPVVTLIGDQEFHGQLGSYVTRIVLSGTQNRLHGAFGTAQGIILLDATCTVRCQIQLPQNADFLLNGGQATLEQDLTFVGSSHIIGSGTVDCCSNRLVFGTCTNLAVTQDLLIKNASTVNLNSENLDLTACLSFQGANILTGNFNNLTFGTNGKIFIKSNSSLTIRNVNLSGIVDGSIVCADNTASLKLHNVHWNQSGGLKFTYGSLMLDSDVRFYGPAALVYESTQGVTINRNSTVSFENTFTFSYVPKNGSNSLLYFTAKSSELHFDRSSFVTGTQGIVLTGGTLSFNDDCYFESERTTTIHSNGQGSFIIGDAVSAHDMNVNFFHSATLTVTKAQLDYKNAKSSSWRMSNGNSLLIINGNAALTLHATLNLNQGFIKLNTNSYLGYPSVVQGNMYFVANGTPVFETLS